MTVRAECLGLGGADCVLDDVPSPEDELPRLIRVAVPLKRGAAAIVKNAPDRCEPSEDISRCSQRDYRNGFHQSSRLFCL